MDLALLVNDFRSALSDAVRFAAARRLNWLNKISERIDPVIAVLTIVPLSVTAGVFVLVGILAGMMVMSMFAIIYLIICIFFYGDFPLSAADPHQIITAINRATERALDPNDPRLVEAMRRLLEAKKPTILDVHRVTSIVDKVNNEARVRENRANADAAMEQARHRLNRQERNG